MKFVEVVDRQIVGNVNEFIWFGDAPIQSHFSIVDMFGIVTVQGVRLRRTTRQAFVVKI